MTAAPNGLGGLAGKVEVNWKDLVGLADEGLKDVAKAGLQGAVEKVKTSSDTLSIAPWSGPTWAALPDVEVDTTWTVGVRAATGIPMVRLGVRTAYLDDYDELVGVLGDLPREATLALDRLALDGVRAPSSDTGTDLEQALSLLIRKLIVRVGAEPTGDTEEDLQEAELLVPPIVGRPPSADLSAALLATTGDRVVLHRQSPLPDAAKDAIKRSLGAAKPVHCPALPAEAPFLALVPDRVQLQVSQEWTLSYLPADDGNRVALELSIIGAFRSRPRSAALFRKAT